MGLKKFYPLTAEEWLKSMKLTNAQKDVLYYIRAIDPYNNGVAVNITEMAHEMSQYKKIHRSTVSRALKFLNREGYVSVKILKVSLKLLGKGILATGGEVQEEVRTGTEDRAETSGTPKKEACAQEQGCAYRNGGVRTRTSSYPHARSTPSKPLLRKDPCSSKNLQTSNTFLERGEEEKNLDPWLEDEANNIPVEETKQESLNNQAIETAEENNSPVEAEIINQQTESVSTLDKDSSSAIVANPGFSGGEVYSACSTFESRFKHRAANPKETNMDRLQEALNWIPDGVWCTSEGKLDPQFISWMCQWWVAEFGGNEHQARWKVTAYFKNDLSRLPLRWEEYSSTYLAKYKNADLRLAHGCKVDENEEKELKDNLRAVTKPLPPEMSCEDKITSSFSLPSGTKPCGNNQTKVSYLPYEENKACIVESLALADAEDLSASSQNNNSGSNVASDSSRKVFKNSRENIDSAVGAAEEVKPLRALAETSDQGGEPIARVVSDRKPDSSILELPRDESGAANNPQAYRYYKAERQENEDKLTSEQMAALKAKITKFTGTFGRGLKEKRDERLDLSDRTMNIVATGRVRLTPEMIQSLNQDLADPILAQSAIAKAKKLGCEILINENNVPIGIEAGF